MGQVAGIVKLDSEAGGWIISGVHSPVAKYQLPKVHACAESKKVLRCFSDIKVTQQS